METPTKSGELSRESADKTIGIIAYLTIFGLIAAMIMNKDKKDPFPSYHIRQSLGLMVMGIALWVVGIIPVIGWLVSILGSLFIIILWVMGFINALNGKEKPVPVFGSKYNEWFKNV